MLKTLLGEEFSAAINGRYLKKYYPSIEIDRCSQASGLQASDTEIDGVQPLEQKILNRGNGQYSDVLPLARNYITDSSCRFIFNNPVAQDYEGVGSRRPGVRSESMLQSFFLCFLSSSLFSCSRTTVTATWKLWG
jgi:hypothetical protein